MSEFHAENEPPCDKGATVNVESVSCVSSSGEAEYKRIVRRVDWHLLPLVTLLYFLSYL